MKREGLARRAAKAMTGLALRSFIRASGRKVGVALLYHGVEERARARADEVVPSTSTQLFAQQLRHLRDHYRVVPASALPGAIADRRRGERIPVAITFDDDDPRYVTNVVPLLRRFDLSATFFLNGASLDEDAWFWWERLQAAWDAGAVRTDVVPALPTAVADRVVSAGGGLEAVASAISGLSATEKARVDALLESRVAPPAARMSEEQVRAVAEAGHEIGFHTLRHDYLPALEGAEVEQAVSDGRERLAAASASSVMVFAYPSGGVSPGVAKAVRHAGYSFAFTTQKGAITPDSDPMALGRIVPPPGNVAQISFEIGRTLAGRPRESV